MGDSESKDASTVEEDDPNILKVSEEVAERILGKPTTIKSELIDKNKPKLYGQEKISQIENDFMNQKNILDNHFRTIDNISEREFKNSIRETEAKFMKHSQYSHPCPEYEEEVLKCYKTNTSNPLTCFSEVNRFKDCMYANRKMSNVM